ncbi:MAG: LytTR family DNA-binding domain-containing protein [Bacteroidota bacterium]
MSALTVAVIDDEEDARELVKIQLEGFSNLNLVGEASDGLAAVSLIDQAKPDIVFLDIQMPELDGIQVVSKATHQPYYVFITAYDEFAVRAFDLNAVDYLLKPFTKQRFQTACDRAQASINKDRFQNQSVIGLLEDIYSLKNTPRAYIQKLSHKSGATTEYINVADIQVINADNQYVNVITKQKQYLLRHSLDYLEEVLDPAIFFRTHRSHLVRLDQIVSTEQYEPRTLLVHLKNGSEIKLSQARKDLLNEKLKLG